MIQMLELRDKDFKPSIINVLKDLKENVVIMNRGETVKKQNKTAILKNPNGNSRAENYNV